MESHYLTKEINVFFAAWILLFFTPFLPFKSVQASDWSFPIDDGLDTQEHEINLEEVFAGWDEDPCDSQNVSPSQKFTSPSTDTSQNEVPSVQLRDNISSRLDLNRCKTYPPTKESSHKQFKEWQYGITGNIFGFDPPLIPNGQNSDLFGVWDKFQKQQPQCDGTQCTCGHHARKDLRANWK